MQLPVSFYKIPSSPSGLSVYEQVYNASIFSVYLPIANEADFKNAFQGRNYGDSPDFYHTLLMTNHMESDPDEFAEGIRGKVLWHNEYRTQKMYDRDLNKKTDKFPTKAFAAAFDPAMAKAPFHNYTCDGCHVRNGSGIPINTMGTLAVDVNNAPIQEFMTSEVYNPYGTPKPDNSLIKDYTFTGHIQPMKLVFFDLQRSTSPLLRAANRSDDSVYSKPLAASQVAQAPRSVQNANSYYKNTIMNFYGDSFHVTRPNYGYSWSYEKAKSIRMVVPTTRHNNELNKDYQPLQVKLGKFTTDTSCQLVKLDTPPPTWPTKCDDINSDAIHKATDEQPAPPVGFMLLNGKRHANSSAIEAIPNRVIFDINRTQSAALGAAIAGELQYNAGSRDGVGGKDSLVRQCATKSVNNCFFGRFGWLGDRVSLEDQVANAAFVEMNMTTKTGYDALKGMMFPIRYDRPNCGPADQTCVTSAGNANLSEQDINRMAAYARWLGNPTRSEFVASLPDVVAGEKIFGDIKCDTCHVIEKIEIRDPNDTMLTKYFRDRLEKRIDKGKKIYPFLSYLGTDLLMHDMGYLSQVGSAKDSIRDPDTGLVLPNMGFEDFVQKIRTPALKGLRFNRFVTDSQKNTKSLCKLLPTDTCDPACDFLLHDGRACDAIEAAFLHDGPAIKKLGVIEGLNGLTKDQVRQLRAFLYSL
jgi:hypothetical protein